VANVVTSVASKVWDGVKGVASFLGNGISGITSFLWKALGTVGGGVLDTIFKISDALSGVVKGIGAAYSRVRDFMTLGLFKAITGIGSFISKIPVLGSVVKGVGSALWTSINAVADGIAAVQRGIGRAVTGAASWLGGVAFRGLGLLTNPGWVLDGPRGWIGAAGRLLGF
jgi:phage-related protein